jgi:hypothetical protein
MPRKERIVPRSIAGYSTNHFVIGGRITTLSEMQERDGEIFRRVKLRCDYGGSRDSFPTFRVFGEIAERLAGMPQGHAVCLGGHVHTYKTKGDKGKERATWSLDVGAILADRASSPQKGAHTDSNTVLLSGKPLGSVRRRTRADKDPRVVVEMCCVGDDAHIDTPKVTGIGDRAEELLRLSEADRMKIVATLVTYSIRGKKFMPMSILMRGVPLD